MQERLTQLIANADLRIRMGDAGRKRYETHFTVERMLNETLDVYMECRVKPK